MEIYVHDNTDIVGKREAIGAIDGETSEAKTASPTLPTEPRYESAARCSSGGMRSGEVM